MSKLSNELQNLIDGYVVKQFGGHPLIKQKLDQLNVRSIVNAYCPSECEIDIGTIAELLVHNRLMSPQPLYKVEKWAGSTVLPELYGTEAAKLTDDRLADALDRIYPHCRTIWTEIALAGLKLCSKELNEIIYDLTSVYFTGVYEEAEEIVHGYSRDGKPENVQIELGINLTAKSGIIIDYHQFKGNTADITTVESNVKKLKELLINAGLLQDNHLIISDRGLIDGKAMKAYQAEGFHYLSMYRTTNETKKALLDNHDKLLCSQINRVDRRGGRFYGVKSSFSIPIKDKSGHMAEEIETTLFIFNSESKGTDDRKRRTKKIKRQLSELKDLSSKLNIRRHKKRVYVEKKIKEILKPTSYYQIDLSGSDGNLKLSYQLDEECIEAEEMYDGIFYAVSDLKLTVLQALEKLKSRDKVEKGIGLLKGPLEVRPLFLHKASRLESLVMLIVVALLIYTLIEKEGREYRVRPRGQSVLSVLAALYVVLVNLKDGSTTYHVTSPTSDQQKILQRFGIFSLKKYQRQLDEFT
jgi:transposase